MAVSFIPEQSELPTIEMRGGSSTEVAEWRLAPPVIDIDWDWVDVRVLAAKNPVVLGASFQSELRDTWVRTAPPDQQRVGWKFQSPTGLTHLVEATYADDYRWKVTFEPTELGRWRYSWTQNFIDTPYQSAEGEFDVVAGDRQNVRTQLSALLESVRVANLESSRERIDRFGERFVKLERAAMQREDPESFRSASGNELLRLLTEIRESLSGNPVPSVLESKALDRGGTRRSGVGE